MGGLVWIRRYCADDEPAIATIRVEARSYEFDYPTSGQDSTGSTSLVENAASFAALLTRFFWKAPHFQNPNGIISTEGLALPSSSDFTTSCHYLAGLFQKQLPAFATTNL